MKEFEPKELPLLALVCTIHGVVTYESEQGSQMAMSRSGGTMGYFKARHLKEHPECGSFSIVKVPQWVVE